MNALTIMTAKLLMSSREIAELTGKRHPDVLRDIRLMLDELKEDVSRFAHIYLDSMNRQQTEYLLDRELTDTLLMVRFLAKHPMVSPAERPGRRVRACGRGRQGQRHERAATREAAARHRRQASSAG